MTHDNAKAPRNAASPSPGADAKGRVVIVSNRLPLRMEDDGKGGLRAVRNVGGLATGLGPLHEREGNLWIGCAEGLESASRRERKRLETP